MVQRIIRVFIFPIRINYVSIKWFSVACESFYLQACLLFLVFFFKFNPSIWIYFFFEIFNFFRRKYFLKLLSFHALFIRIIKLYLVTKTSPFSFIELVVSNFDVHIKKMRTLFQLFPIVTSSNIFIIIFCSFCY